MPVLLGVFLLLLALVALDLAALRWGADSTTGQGGLEQGPWRRERAPKLSVRAR